MDHRGAADRRAFRSGLGPGPRDREFSPRIRLRSVRVFSCLISIVLGWKFGRLRMALFEGSGEVVFDYEIFEFVGITAKTLYLQLVFFPVVVVRVRVFRHG